MDVAVFVGFAASGPLHIPVAVDDTAQFEAIFGNDALLARDAATGGQVYAHLAPTVRCFFKNGGKRCWIIRVAQTEASDTKPPSPHTARYNYFPIPGLARLTEENGTLEVEPAIARARSEGSWSDSLRVGTFLSSEKIEVDEIMIGERTAEIHVKNRREKLSPGDLLRMAFEGGEALLCPVESVELPATTLPPGRTIVHVSIRNALWMQQIKPGSPPQDSLTVDIAVTEEGPPVPGSVLFLDLEGQQVVMTVQRIENAETETSSPQTSVKVTGQVFRFGQNFPETLPKLVSGEIITFGLSVHRGSDYSVSLPGLGLTPQHNRYWGKLPTDREYYGRQSGPALAGEKTAKEKTINFWSLTDGSRFPLAHNDENGNKKTIYYLPVGMQYFPEDCQRIAPFKSSLSPLERDGLASFKAELFLDPGLAGYGTETFMSQADFLRYLSPSPRSLTGIHAALEVEEATIISVPDAVHRGWQQIPLPPPATAPEAVPEYRPEWWHGATCVLTAEERKKRSEDEAYRVEKPDRANFLDCEIDPLPSPVIKYEAPDPSGTFVLSWTLVPGAHYVLQETVTEWSAAAEIYQGYEHRMIIYNRPPNDYFYRVRASASNASSDWSAGCAIRVGATPPWAQNNVKTYAPNTLLEVHRALARMCAARGDVFAVLALPAHYRENDALAYANILRLSSSPEAAGGGETLSSEFSYAALYHPWLITRAEGAVDSFRAVPPDGGICGIMAKRAVERGAWVAPANDALQGCIALTPPISAEKRLALQDARVNLVRQEPRGFLVLDADTLSNDPELRPIGVRRLLMLLRRTALRVGAQYVFEPNDKALRRSVQRGFGAMLAELHKRGAFKGATSAEAYQVITDDSLNTAHSMDQGRFIAELRIAPSRPMTFLTVRILQSGEHLSLVEGR